MAGFVFKTNNVTKQPTEQPVGFVRNAGTDIIDNVLVPVVKAPIIIAKSGINLFTNEVYQRWALNPFSDRFNKYKAIADDSVLQAGAEWLTDLVVPRFLRRSANFNVLGQNIGFDLDNATKEEEAYYEAHPDPVGLAGQIVSGMAKHYGIDKVVETGDPTFFTDAYAKNLEKEPISTAMDTAMIFSIALGAAGKLAAAGKPNSALAKIATKMSAGLDMAGNFIPDMIYKGAMKGGRAGLKGMGIVIDPLVNRMSKSKLGAMNSTDFLNNTDIFVNDIVTKSLRKSDEIGAGFGFADWVETGIIKGSDLLKRKSQTMFENFFLDKRIGEEAIKLRGAIGLDVDNLIKNSFDNLEDILDVEKNKAHTKSIVDVIEAIDDKGNFGSKYTYKSKVSVNGKTEIYPIGRGSKSYYEPLANKIDSLVEKMLDESVAPKLRMKAKAQLDEIRAKGESGWKTTPDEAQRMYENLTDKQREVVDVITGRRTRERNVYTDELGYSKDLMNRQNLAELLDVNSSYKNLLRKSKERILANMEKGLDSKVLSDGFRIDMLERTSPTIEGYIKYIQRNKDEAQRMYKMKGGKFKEAVQKSQKFRSEIGSKAPELSTEFYESLYSPIADYTKRENQKMYMKELSQGHKVDKIVKNGVIQREKLANVLTPEPLPKGQRKGNKPKTMVIDGVKTNPDLDHFVKDYGDHGKVRYVKQNIAPLGMKEDIRYIREDLHKGVRRFLEVDQMSNSYLWATTIMGNLHAQLLTNPVSFVRNTAEEALKLHDEVMVAMLGGDSAKLKGMLKAMPLYPGGIKNFKKALSNNYGSKLTDAFLYGNQKVQDTIEKMYKEGYTTQAQYLETLNKFQNKVFEVYSIPDRWADAISKSGTLEKMVKEMPGQFKSVDEAWKFYEGELKKSFSNQDLNALRDLEKYMTESTVWHFDYNDPVQLLDKLKGAFNDQTVAGAVVKSGSWMFANFPMMAMNGYYNRLKIILTGKNLWNKKVSPRQRLAYLVTASGSAATGMQATEEGMDVSFTNLQMLGGAIQGGIMKAEETGQATAFFEETFRRAFDHVKISASVFQSIIDKVAYNPLLGVLETSNQLFNPLPSKFGDLAAQLMTGTKTSLARETLESIGAISQRERETEFDVLERFKDPLTKKRNKNLIKARQKMLNYLDSQYNIKNENANINFDLEF